MFEFGIKGVRRVLNKHDKVTTMRQVYCECPPGFRWAWKDPDRNLADTLRIAEQLSLISNCSSSCRIGPVRDSSHGKTGLGGSTPRNGPAGKTLEILIINDKAI